MRTGRQKTQGDVGDADVRMPGVEAAQRSRGASAQQGVVVNGSATTGVPRTLLRTGAVAGITGLALQLILEFFFHPSAVDPNNSAEVFVEYAGYDLWTAVHIGQFFGTLLIGLALIAVYRSVSQQRGRLAPLATFGAFATVLVGAVFAVQMAIDGVALKGAIDAWMSAAPADKPAAFLVADGVRWVEKGLSGFFHLGNGVALVFLGLATAGSQVHPRWLGWTGTAAGIGFLAGGTSVAHTGFSMEADMILLLPAVLAGVFLIGMSVSMWRRAGRA